MTYRDYGIYPVVGTKMWCPVCGSYFKATDDTRYIRHKMYVCSWKCFRDSSKDPIEEPQEEQLVEVTVKVASTGRQNNNKTTIKGIKIQKNDGDASNKVSKSAKSASNKTPKGAKNAEIPMEKCDDLSQKTPKKCDKVELF